MDFGTTDRYAHRLALLKLSPVLTSALIIIKTLVNHS